MALERPHALAKLDVAGVVSPGNSELPELDCLVQTTADQVAAVGCKSNRVHTVTVTVRVLQTLHQVTSSGVPDANTLVQRTRGNVVTIGRHGHRSHTIPNAESVHELAVENIPQTNCLVTATRRDVPSVAGEIEGVDVLLVSRENVLDGTGSNIPNLENLLNHGFSFLVFFFSCLFLSLA